MRDRIFFCFCLTGLCLSLFFLSCHFLVSPEYENTLASSSVSDTSSDEPEDTSIDDSACSDTEEDSPETEEEEEIEGISKNFSF